MNGSFSAESGVLSTVRFARPGDPVNHCQDREDADPRGDTADDLRLRSAEEPTQVVALISTKHAQGLKPEDPTGVEPNGEVERARSEASVAKNDSYQEETDQAGKDLPCIQKGGKGRGKKFKPGEWVNARKRRFFSRLDKMNRGIKKVGDDESRKRFRILHEALENDPAKEDFLKTTHRESGH